MHCNVHLLLHLCDNVQNWGPLYSVNTFPFENENKLLQMKTSNFRVAQQIVNRLLVYQQLPTLQNAAFISENVKEFCTYFKETKLKHFCKVGDCVLIGNGVPHTLSVEEIQSLNDIIDVEKIDNCKKYSKIIYNRCRYTSFNYQ